jgi:BASS family bile acid:Na+ symporter
MSELRRRMADSASRERFWRLYGRTIMLLIAMAAGFLCPWAAPFSVALPFMLIGMLFFAFLDMSVTRDSFRVSILGIFLANLVIPVAVYLLLRPIRPDLALVGFISAIAPTATATPVIMGFLHGRIEYVVTSVLLTNVGIALILPFLLPLVADPSRPVSTAEVLPSTLLVMFVPLGTAWLVRRLPPAVPGFFRRGKPLAFLLWLLVIFAVTAKASAFLQNGTGIAFDTLAEIAVLSLAICALNFILGAWIGGRTFRKEGSQSLGQKNNSFTIWLALTYLNPLAALGPTFYVAYHNLYNGWMLYESERNRPGHSPSELKD